MEQRRVEKEEEDVREKEEEERREVSVYYCLLLSAVRNLRMWSWSVVEKFSLNCLLISISGNSTWIELEGGRQDGKKNEVFIFLFFFVNSFVCLFFCTVFYHHYY